MSTQTTTDSNDAAANPGSEPAVKTARKRATVKKAAKKAPKKATRKATTRSVKQATVPTSKRSAGRTDGRPAGKPSAKPATRPSKADKPKKTKLVRDSFTMPDTEYALISHVKKACMSAGIEIKKSEILRIGVALIAKLDPKKIKAAQAALLPLKAGRPKKHK